MFKYYQENKERLNDKLVKYTNFFLSKKEKEKQVTIWSWTL